MATYQLGPEVPIPFSCISEDLIHIPDLDSLPDGFKPSFGAQYESKMCELVNTYLELGTDDKLLFIGKENDNIIDTISQKFCLLENATMVTADEFLKLDEHVAVEGKTMDLCYSRILIKDAIQCFSDTKSALTKIMNKMKPSGRMLIIHRPADILTLPVSANIKSLFKKTDCSYMMVIKHLQELYYDTQWSLEQLPVTLSKTGWFSLMKANYLCENNKLKPDELKYAIRELKEGVMKYGDNDIEFVDRLLLISASHTFCTDYPNIDKGASSLKTKEITFDNDHSTQSPVLYRLALSDLQNIENN